MNKKATFKTFLSALIVALLTANIIMRSSATEINDKTHLPHKESTSLRAKISASIKNNHELRNSEQENIYSNIIEKYIKPSISLSSAVEILKEVGFDITVLGEGFFEPYPSVGVPVRGTTVSATYSYKQGFLSGNVLGVHLFMDSNDHAKFTEVKISVGTVGP